MMGSGELSRNEGTVLVNRSARSSASVRDSFAAEFVGIELEGHSEDDCARGGSAKTWGTAAAAAAAT
jgi:hypothetical protein